MLIKSYMYELAEFPYGNKIPIDKVKREQEDFYRDLKVGNHHIGGFGTQRALEQEKADAKKRRVEVAAEKYEKARLAAIVRRREDERKGGRHTSQVETDTYTIKGPHGDRQSNSAESSFIRLQRQNIFRWKYEITQIEKRIYNIGPMEKGNFINDANGRRRDVKMKYEVDIIKKRMNIKLAMEAIRKVANGEGVPAHAPGYKGPRGKSGILGRDGTTNQVYVTGGGGGDYA
jgi:hypothetical protein